MIWDAVKYGHNVLWAVTVAGIPVVWIERATGKTLPSGFTAEDASLVIDSSGDVGIEHVDRQRGVAVAMPLKFKLLDTAETRSWIRRWMKLMTLTADLDASDTAATVDDSTGWANGDAVWLGLERITIGTVASSTSLTGITRATAGSMAYQHRAGTTAQALTDRPRFWRGRDVVLWAVPVDPSGFVPGATLLADAVQVWRGRIESGPVREIDGFAFEAADFGRVLDQGLLGSVTGKLVDTSTKYKVASGWSAHVHLLALDGAGATVWEYDLTLSPFDADADGDLLAPGDIRDRVASAWSDTVSAAGAGADVGSLKWTFEKGYHKARVQIVNDATVVKVARWTYLDGAEVWFEEPDPYWYAGMTADAWIPIGWQSAGNPLIAYSALEGPKGSASLTVQLDEGAIADVPSAGYIRVQAGNQIGVFAFSGVGSTGNDLYLADVKPVGGAKLDTLTGNAAVGAAVELLLAASGTLTSLMLAVLESSGTTAMRGALDFLVRGQGYSIDDDQIDLLSFANASAPLSALQCEVNCAGASFVELFGGSLGLFRAAVVCRPDVSATGSPQRLALISTAPYGAGWASTITDDDLLSHEGDPLLAVDRSESPNVITVSRPVGLTSDEADKLTLADNPSGEAQGRREVEYRVPAASRDALWPVAKAAAASHLAADQTLQVLSVRVAPWVRGECGDVVNVELTHPAIWTWASNPGGTGYSGPARILGRTINPATLRVQLLLLIDGALTIRALSPAMEVSAFQHATAPTWIEVPVKYQGHLQAALEAAAGPIWLYHYKPGAVETVGERHQISAVANVAGVCRLTVAANPTGHTLSTVERSTLTLPTTSGGHLSSWQESFAHVDDGTQWG
jgi:hypothetical protein